MTEKLTAHAEEIENSRIAKYKGGEVSYSIVGEQIDEHNPIVLVNGFSRGRKALHRFAIELNSEGHRQVVEADQPRTNALLNPINNQAEALLAILEDSGLEGQTVDFVAHSFGSLILSRAAEIAKQRGLDMTPFNYSKGSRSIFLAPSGSIANETPIKLGMRFKKHLESAKANGRRGVYPEVDAEAVGNLKGHPLKYLREGVALGRKKVQYSKLDDLGLKPMVLGYPKDVLFPPELTGPLMAEHGEDILGYAMPLNPKGAHDDPIFNPEPTAKAVLQLLDLEYR